MQVRVQSGGVRNPPKMHSDVDSTVLYNDQGAPFAVAMDLNGHVWWTTSKDDDFEEQLRLLGITLGDRP